MILQSEAIVLSTQKFRETSLIVKLYTRQHGLESLIAKGVRTKSKRQRAIYLQPSALLDVVYYVKKGRDLQNLTDYTPAQHYARAWQQPQRMLYAMLGVEVFGGAVREVEPNPELYQLLRDYLLAVDAENAQIFDRLMHFLLALCDAVGILPQIDSARPDQPKVLLMEEGRIEDSPSRLTTGAGGHIYRYLTGQALIVPRAEREQLIQTLLRYFDLHLEGFRQPKSLEVFKAVFQE